MVVHNIKEEDVFLVARQIDVPEVRAEYLRQACGENHELLARIKALLAAHELDRGYLASPAGYIDLATRDTASAMRIDDEIGVYKLREQIGEGGMGVVYVAEQTEPVKRKVALKIIKAGMACAEVVNRFEAERQALAMMDHPHIAKVFDGGATTSGRPYFVMELVQGLPITDYCDEHQLSTDERLRLFVTACRAIQHAHQKGIIHRDLKPSNIIVAEIDGQPVAKVIDFGVAKAIGQSLTDGTLYTQFSQMVGTPLYMSPEQAGLGVLDIDTRSDVYSLGVLLYELLTGLTPFDSDALKQAGFDEMRRIIREDEPAKPSAMVSTLGAEARSTLSQRRSSDLRKLCDSLSGELDWLVMKALEKDRNRRYESASALADDVERYLGEQPIAARAPSSFYRTKKYIRRHRVFVASALVVLVALAGGLLLASIGFLQAERRLAEVEAEQQNNRVLIDLLSDIYPRQWGISTGGDRTIYDSMDELSTDLDQRLKDHPEVEIKVRRIFATAFSEADQFDRYREHLQRALEVAIDTHGEQHEQVAELHALLADEVGWNGSAALNFAELLKHANRAIEIYEALEIETSGTAMAWFARGWCLKNWPERFEEAVAAQTKCIELNDRLLTQDLAVGPRMDLGDMLMSRGDRFEEAKRELECALAIIRSQKRHDPMVAVLHSYLSKCARGLGDIDGALRSCHEAQLFYQDNNLQHEPIGLSRQADLAELQFASGDVRGAFETIADLENWTRQHGPDASLSHCLRIKGYLYFQLEDYAAAKECFEQATKLSVSFEETDLRFAWPRAYLAFSADAQQATAQATRSYAELHAWTTAHRRCPTVAPLPYYVHARVLPSVHLEIPETKREALQVAIEGLECVQTWRRTWHEPAFHMLIAELQRQLDYPAATVRDSLEQGLAAAVEPAATYMATHREAPNNRAALERALADWHQENDDVEQAAEVLSEGVRYREQQFEDNRHIQIAMAKLRLGELLVAHANKIGEAMLHKAKEVLLDAHKILQPHPDEVRRLRQRAAASLAKAFQALGQPEAAAEWEAINVSAADNDGAISRNLTTKGKD